MATQQCLPMPGLNATPGTLMRLQPMIRRLTQDWDGFNPQFARILGALEESHSATLHLVRGRELVYISRVVETELTDAQRDAGIPPFRVVSAEDDRNSLGEAGRIHPATALQDEMAFIFSDGKTARWFSTKERDFVPRRNVELLVPTDYHQILLPLYIQAKDEAPEGLGVLSLEGKNLFWKGSTCQTETDQVLEIMLILSMLSTGISSKLEAGTDALTRLIRKKEFYRELNAALNDSKRKNTTDVSVIMVDIDHFKRINDEHGHLMGDRVLETIAGALMDGVRTEQKIARIEQRNAVIENPLFDVVARYGGEEFAILVMASFENTLKIAERIRQRIEDAGRGIEGIKNAVTCSFGVTGLSKCINTIEDIGAETGRLLIERADQMLYQAKGNGRNRVEPQPDTTDWAL